jgi:hypothetical protein
MAWFKRGDGSMSTEEERRKTDDIEIDPAKLKTDLTTEFKGQLDSFKTAQDESLKPVLSFVEEMRAEREERKAAETRRKQEEARKANEVDDTDFLLDPSSAVDKKLQGTKNAVFMLAARQARAEVLGEKEYYYGNIKNEVDKMIEAQPLQQQSNTQVIENCYKLVMYDKQKDIAEGKIKAKNNAASFESNGTGGHSGKSGSDHEEEMSQDEKFAASALGLSEKDWKTSKKELTYV